MKKIFYNCVCILFLSFLAATGYAQEKGIKIIEKDGKFHLMIDGVDTYIKGVGGTNRLDMAAANGSNAFRTWDGSVERAKSDLARAKKLNMYVMQGISLPKDSMRYKDEAFKTRTMESVRALAEALKGEPNLLIWGIGNEVELDGANIPVVWQFINELALLIKSIDSRSLTKSAAMYRLFRVFVGTKGGAYPYLVQYVCRK
jgi:hypothetical protein